ncbi:MAG TPA: exodeoxyribonuclease III [Gammaproteobacteria bacterium]
MKIASWNVNSLRVRLPQVLDWLASRQPDVLAIQETKLTDDKFPVDELAQAGYRAVFHGQPTYNGVAILAREPLEDVRRGMPGFDDEQARVIAATVSGVRILDLYVPNGQEVGSEKYAYKLRWLAHLEGVIADELKRHPKLVVLGDFNIAPADGDVHDPEAWRGKVLFSEPEKAALERLLAHGLVDSFRLFEQEPATFSWWDYRAAGFRRNLGLRIDLVLLGEALAGGCTDSVIDREPRAWERPSDHAPAVATLELND